MQENNIEQNEEVSVKNKQPSREEILAASREENKNGDERENQFLLKANSYALSIGLIMAGIIIIVTSFVEKRFPIEVLLVVAAMQSVQSFIMARGVRKTRKIYTVLGICESIAAVIILVIWILMLCGVLA